MMLDIMFCYESFRLKIQPSANLPRQGSIAKENLKNQKGKKKLEIRNQESIYIKRALN